MRKSVPAVLAGVMIVGGLFATQGAYADHEPANKVAASGSTVEVAAPGQTIPVLQERVKVSSSFDLILQLASECDILTELTTGGEGRSADTASAFGQVRMFITIDGKTVPITQTQTGADGDDGKVVFCNRAHTKSIEDQEDNLPMDGTDEERDMTQTRQANAFNWLALDVGFNYDNPANGNNVVDIIVFAEFTETTENRGVAEALIGNRTLIAEPTNASNHEWVRETDESGGN